MPTLGVRQPTWDALCRNQQRLAEWSFVIPANWTPVASEPA